MIKKILVAIDFSERTQLVFNTAISLAQATKATLMMVHVVFVEEVGHPVLPTNTYYKMLGDRSFEEYRTVLINFEQQGLELLQDLSKQCTEAGVASEYTQLSGNPGRMICELANNWSAEVIMVGSRGLKGISEMFLGSVSNYITHHAPCSVYIVRTEIAPQLVNTLSSA